MATTRCFLLETPLELFQSIMKEAIQGVDIKQAVRMRLVCKTFNAETVNSIHNTRAIEGIKAVNRRRRIPREWLAQWLFDRALHLPNTAQKYSNAVLSAAWTAFQTSLEIVRHRGEDSDDSLKHVLRKVCACIVGYVGPQLLDSKGLHASFNGKSSSALASNSSIVQHAVAAAAYLGDVPLLSKLLSEQQQASASVQASAATPILNACASNSLWMGAPEWAAALNGHFFSVRRALLEHHFATIPAPMNGDYRDVLIVAEKYNNWLRASWTTLEAGCRGGREGGTFASWMVHCHGLSLEILRRGLREAAVEGHAATVRMIMRLQNETTWVNEYENESEHRNLVLSDVCNFGGGVGMRDVIWALLDGGATPDTAVMRLAIDQDDGDFMQELLARGAKTDSVNAKYPSCRRGAEKGVFALTYAAEKDKTAIMRVLLAHGVSEFGDDDALEYAVRAKSYGAVALLLSLLAYTHTNHGKSMMLMALGLACWMGDTYQVRLLAEHGANVNGAAKFRIHGEYNILCIDPLRTPMQAAKTGVASNKEDVVKVLKEFGAKD